MKYVKLGNSGVKVSQLCLGTWHLPVLPELDEYGVHKVDKELSLKLFKKAYDLGITFFDTANRYAGSMQTADLNHVGTSEKILGEFLKSIDRESIILATKVRGKMGPWPHGEGLSRKHIMWQIKESLKRLNTTYIDLYQIHWPDPDTPKLETLRTLDSLVKQGLVYYIGESNHSAHDIVEFMELSERYNLERFVSMQERYNIIDRRIEADKIPVAQRYGLALLVYSPLHQGLLTTKYVDFQNRTWKLPELSRASLFESVKNELFNDRNLKILLELNDIAKEKGITISQLALAWLIKRQEELNITIIPIIGVTSENQLLENIESLNVNLSSDDMKRIEELTKQS